MLEVHLLGQFNLRQHGQPVGLPSRTAQSLLAYLVLRAGTRHRREQLAGMLWPNSDEANARSNLRAALWRVNKALGQQYLQSDRVAVMFNPSPEVWVDVHVLCLNTTALGSTDDLRASVAAYTGELLPGFYEDWVMLERERLRALFERKMEQLLNRLLQERHWTEAIVSAEHWIAAGEVAEPAYRALMIAHHHVDGEASVVAVYRRCVTALQRELGVEPADQTRAVYEQIVRGELARALLGVVPGDAAQAPASVREPAAHEPAVVDPGTAGRPPEPGILTPHTPALPQPATPFVGRAVEQAELAALLDDPACRLLTLTGLGGIGKTRLALGVAAERARRYPHGVWFVNLAPLSSTGAVVSAIAEVFRLNAQGVVNLREALRNYLREKTLLLVLDNFEHVLDAAGLVGELLDAAPALQVMVTSRERLYLRAERVFAVGGLPVPTDAAHPGDDTFDAVRMFVAYVRHAYPQYRLDAIDMSAVRQICRLVGGMPLGIELAAAWVPTLPAKVIAAELATSLDMLATDMRDVPERHRSARAAFEHSWNLLTAEEQELFRQLAVFRGGFVAEAAQQAVGAKPGTLARLVNKSLVRVHQGGRYDMHELLLQFAQAKLVADREAPERASKRHGVYFLAWLAAREPELKGRQQLSALDALDQEFENVRTAWMWAIRHARWEELRRSFIALHFYLEVRSRHQEAIELLRPIADALTEEDGTGEEAEQRQRTAAIAGTLLSWFFNRLGQSQEGTRSTERSRAAVHRFGTPYERAMHSHLSAGSRPDPEEARALSEEALTTFRGLGATWEVAFVVDGMGHMALAQEQLFTARQFHSEALALWRTTGESVGTSSALSNLARVAYALGEFDEARQLLEESLRLQQAVGSRILIAGCLELLGQIAWAQSLLAEAEAHLRQELAIIRDLGYQEPLSWRCSRLGAVLLAQGLHADAAEVLAEALAIAESTGDPRGLACAHTQLGYLAFEQGDSHRAMEHWRTCLTTVSGTQGRDERLVMLDAIVGVAGQAIRAGQPERAVMLLAWVGEATVNDRTTHSKAERLLVEAESLIPPERFRGAQALGRRTRLERIVAEILAQTES